MKKALLALALFLFSITGVNARTVCEVDAVNEYLNQLESFNYDLEYKSDYIDDYGIKQEGFFLFKFSNVPNGFEVILTDGYHSYSSLLSEEIPLTGGVYTLKFYQVDCEQLIKTYEIKVPSYKQYCDLDKDCNVWFDGTYENKLQNLFVDEEGKINTKLIIVLVSLLIIIVIFIGIFLIKRRKIS